MQVIKTYHPLENFRLRITRVNCFFVVVVQNCAIFSNDVILQFLQITEPKHVQDTLEV